MRMRGTVNFASEESTTFEPGAVKLAIRDARTSK